MENIIILFMAGCLAYILSELYAIADGYIAKCKLNTEKKKRFSNDLYRFKLKAIYYFTINHNIKCGMTREQARNEALKYVISLDENNYTDYKYQLIRGFGNERIGNKGCCK